MLIFNVYKWKITHYPKGVDNVDIIQMLTLPVTYMYIYTFFFFFLIILHFIVYHITNNIWNTQILHIFPAKKKKKKHTKPKISGCHIYEFNIQKFMYDS